MLVRNSCDALGEPHSVAIQNSWGSGMSSIDTKVGIGFFREKTGGKCQTLVLD